MSKQKVRATFKMDSATFELHMTHRHNDSLGGLTHIHALAFEQEEMYRSFHRRLHDTRADLDHEHGNDPLDASVRRAIERLLADQRRGWFEISGVPGEFVSVFPDGQIATRIEGRIAHHESVDEAVARLTSIIPVSA